MKKYNCLAGRVMQKLAVQLLPVFSVLLIAPWVAANEALPADLQPVEITAEQWAIPRHGERLLKFQQLQQLYRQWHNLPGAIITIHYPGGEAGELWIEEMVDWLVSLGIPSSQIQSLPGSGAKDIIRLVISSSGEIE